MAKVVAIAREIGASSDAVIVGHIAAYLHGWSDSWPEFHAYPIAALPIGRSRRTARAIRTEIRDGVRVPALADLIAVALRTARKGVMGLIDISPAIGLIERYRLDKCFARSLSRDTRPFFRHLIDKLRQERCEALTHPHRF